MKKYFLEGPEDFKLIPQKRTKVHFFLGEEDHNSIWDTTMGPDGKLYMSMSSELTNGGYARLYEYDYKTDCARKLIDVEKVILPQDRAIRASKFHTSISFMNDHKLAMTTHSTDKAPQHPTWMPFSFFGNMWEGFAGSNIVTYDLETGHAENLGIPAVHESLYGSCYDKKHNAFYSMGFMKGHLYRYDFDTHEAKDMGKVSEMASFRMVPGPDGNLYATSRSGYLFKIDTDKQEIVDMNYRVPFFRYGEQYDFSVSFANISVGRIGPDGRVYLAFMYGPDILALDTATGEVENMGPYLDTLRYAKGENRNGIFGMDFDDKGRLWYIVNPVNNGENPMRPACPAGLFCWDITKKGARPEWKGILGVSACVSTCPSMMYIHENTLLAVEQFHGKMAPCVYAIDLSQYDEGGDVLVSVDPNMLEDRMFHEGDPEQYGYSLPFDQNDSVCAQNPNTFDAELDSFYRIWRELAPDHIDDSKVKGLAWDGSELWGLCGEKAEYVFCIKNGKTEIVPAEKAAPEKLSWLKAAIENSVTVQAAMPYYPGRQFMAVPVVEVTMASGKKLVGTRDGLLALADGDRVYSLGMCGYNGPIRDMAVTPDGKTVYGVAGDPEDLGMVFRYTDEKGLELLGNIAHPSAKLDGIVASNVLSACCISADGKKLAIGSADRIGTVYIYNI